MPSSNPLPPKENALFKRILKCYEHKLYKNGLKFAKQILSNSKFTEHGETLAMKGLTLNCLGRKDEAYDCVRRGLRNDLRSHVCWHVYGLLQRSDKKYDEAIKCYRNALKWDKDNLQILRDLSLLQIQMRDLEGYRDTRYQLLMLRPTHRVSWIGYAMSFHLLEDYKNALAILEDFLDQQKESFDYEHSELLLYQNMVIQESGDIEGALCHLDKCEGHVVDRLAVEETLAELYLKSRRYENAATLYADLVDRNPENTIYYSKLIEARQITDPERIVDTYLEFERLYPKAMPPRRLPLNYASGDRFRTLADKYLRRGLHKGVPPLFVDMRALYKDRLKAQAIERLLLGYVDSLKSKGKFCKTDRGEREPASALLWVYYYLAQHCDHLGHTERALGYIDAAIEHTPTLIELFVVKGRIYKHAGDAEEAFRWLDEAQALDTADRYINSKCAKYMLRANMIKEAEEMCAKFTREGVSAMENLNEMQCMWFQTECALAYQRLGQWGESLKKCHEVDRHFSEIIEDQFDFHTYCMRKMTLRSYVGLLRLEDVLRSHPFYFKAARCAIEVYLHLHDHPLKDEAAEQENATENLAPAELKKMRNKMRKARRKAEQESAQAAQAQVRREQHNKSRQQADVEPDAPQLDELVPEKLARTDDPLEQAARFLRPLQTLAAGRVDTHLMAFEIHRRRGKVLLMLQSVRRAHRLAPDEPRLHGCLVHFHEFVTEATERASQPPAVRAVIDAGLATLLGGRDARRLTADFLDRHTGHSLRHTLEGARTLHRLQPAERAKALTLVTQLPHSATLTEAGDVTIQDCVDVLKALRDGEFGACNRRTEEDFLERCRVRFPYATAFRVTTPVPAATTPAPTSAVPLQNNHVSEEAFNTTTPSKDCNCSNSNDNDTTNSAN